VLAAPLKRQPGSGDRLDLRETGKRAKPRRLHRSRDHRFDRLRPNEIGIAAASRGAAGLLNPRRAKPVLIQPARPAASPRRDHQQRRRQVKGAERRLHLFLNGRSGRQQALDGPPGQLLVATADLLFSPMTTATPATMKAAPTI